MCAIGRRDVRPYAGRRGRRDMNRSPNQVRSEIGRLLPFIATPFTPDNEIDPNAYRRNLRYLTDCCTQQPSCYFVCCGTGEFWSLSLGEYASLVRTAADEVGDSAPIVAGIGYGTPLAREFARAGEDAGADALLVFPPYLVSAPQEGLLAHYAAVAASTRLGVFVYNRDNAVFEPDTMARLVEVCPNVIGVKDGYGDLTRLGEMRRILGDEFLIMNGMPCAELHAWTYGQAGFAPYSPSAIEFLPELAWAFDHALEAGDKPAIERMTEAFYKPYIDLRLQVPGYGVSLIKAGLGLRARPVGCVRSPLVDPSPDHLAQLKVLIQRGLETARN